MMAMKLGEVDFALAKKRERLSADYPVGSEVYSLYGDTIHTVESYDDNLKGLICVRTYVCSGWRYKNNQPDEWFENETRTERTYFELEGLSQRLIPTSQTERIREAQLRVYGIIAVE